MTTAEKLADAKSKLHKLVTGSLRETVRDGDVTVTYTQANKGALEKYIEQLEGLLAIETNGARRRRPAGVIF